MAEESKDYVSVSNASLDLRDIAAMVSDARAGATSTFSGTTRDNHNGKKVVRLEYEGYVPMAELELKKICCQIREKWDVIHVALAHRLGVTQVEEASVIIAVSSVHRKDSLEAVQYAIDTLKATVPIWKLEVYEGDSRVWKENAEWNGSGCCRKMVPIERTQQTMGQGSGEGEVIVNDCSGNGSVRDDASSSSSSTAIARESSRGDQGGGEGGAARGLLTPGADHNHDGACVHKHGQAPSC